MVLEKVLFWREIDFNSPTIEKWAERITPACAAVTKVLEFVNRKINYVKIDRWDTYSMDSTLAYIVLPTLKQIRDVGHGAPFTSDEDVPEELRSTASLPTNDLHFDSNFDKRWQWILGEMIFAFDAQVSEPDVTDEARMQNGFELFGKYYRALWV